MTAGDLSTRTSILTSFLVPRAYGPCFLKEVEAQDQSRGPEPQQWLSSSQGTSISAWL